VPGIERMVFPFPNGRAEPLLQCGWGTGSDEGRDESHCTRGLFLEKGRHNELVISIVASAVDLLFVPLFSMHMYGHNSMYRQATPVER